MTRRPLGTKTMVGDLGESVAHINDLTIFCFHLAIFAGTTHSKHLFQWVLLDLFDSQTRNSSTNH